MATNMPDGNSSYGPKCLELIRHVEEAMEEILSKKYMAKMCDTAWERLRRIIAMGAMYVPHSSKIMSQPFFFKFLAEKVEFGRVYKPKQ